MNTVQPAVASATITSRRKKILARIWMDRYLYLLILPGIAATILFAYVPMYGIQIAFKDYKIAEGIWGSKWVGLYNFRILFQSPDFARVMKNTLIISFGRIITGFPAPLILALLLNELRNDVFKRISQSILYLPHFLSWIIMAGIIFNLLSIRTGVVNKVLESFHLQPIQMLGNPKTFRPLLYITDIWKEAGWGTIIYLAAIAGIDVEMYEAARIDGASRFQQVLYITIPSLAYAISTLLILRVGGIMNAGFDQVFNLINPPTREVGEIIDTYVYQLGVVEARYSYTTAIGLFKNIINCVLMLSTNWIAKRMGQEGFM